MSVGLPVAAPAMPALGELPLPTDHWMLRKCWRDRHHNTGSKDRYAPVDPLGDLGLCEPCLEELKE